MTKKKSGTRRYQEKIKGGTKKVDEYCARVPKRALSTFNKLREVIRAVVPAEATETISYGIPAFKRGKVLVWFAAFSNHCSLFPTGAVIEELRNELKGFTTSKGTVQFPLDKSLPVALVRKIVKARVKQTKIHKHA